MIDRDDDPDGAGARVRRIRGELEEGRTLCLLNGGKPTEDAMRVAETIALHFLGVLQQQTGSPVLQRMVNAAYHDPPGRPKIYDDTDYLDEIEAKLAANPKLSFNRVATNVAATVAATEQELHAAVKRFERAFKKRKVST